MTTGLFLLVVVPVSIGVKSSPTKQNPKDILQARDYRIFIQEHFGTTPHSYNSVVSYVVTGFLNEDKKILDTLAAFGSNGTIYLKTYHELLTNAKDYHREFIDRYNRIVGKP
jgi:hypothetical protein